MKWNISQHNSHRCNFSKSIGGGGGRGQRAKSAQGTTKIPIESDFSSNLTTFHANIGGGGGAQPIIGGSTQHWGGGGLGPSQKRYKVTPLLISFFTFYIFTNCLQTCLSPNSSFASLSKTSHIFIFISLYLHIFISSYLHKHLRSTFADVIASHVRYCHYIGEPESHCSIAIGHSTRPNTVLQIGSAL